MELRTNCKNCGASLHYDKTSYGKTAICEYCRQEYHIDLLGRVEEYKNGRLITTKPIYKTKIKLIEI